jgi:hypothetical protein
MNEGLEAALDTLDDFELIGCEERPYDELALVLKTVRHPNLDAMTERICHIASKEIYPDWFMDPEKIRPWVQSILDAAFNPQEEE